MKKEYSYIQIYKETSSESMRQGKCRGVTTQEHRQSKSGEMKSQIKRQCQGAMQVMI